MNQQRVKIAIQKSGRLSDATMDLLKRCGLKNNQPKDRLITHIKNMPIDILRVRDDDIPGLVMEGVVDLGFVGDNTVQEVRLKREKTGKVADYEQLIKLDYGQCQLSIAVPEERKYSGIADLQSTRIATSYPYLLSRFLEEQDVTAQIVHLKGAVEVAPRANLSDAICDLVSSGVTLEANGLREVDVMFKSTAVLIQRVGIPQGNIKSIIEMLIPRINSVMQAKESKYIMMHAPLDQLDNVIKLLPGAEKPTVLPLAGVKDQVAIHVVSSETVFWETMESLKKLGASSILILPIEKMMA